MTIRWWDSPGPAEFLRRVYRSLCDGTSVLVRFPAHAPRGFLEAVETLDRRERSPAGDCYLVDPAEASVVGQQPAAFLHHRFAPLPEAGVPATALSLIQHERFRRFLLLIDLAGCTGASSWLLFLREYRDLARDLEDAVRPVFCVTVQDSPGVRIPATDVLLEHAVWRGQVAPSDMAFYVALRGRNGRVRGDVAQARLGAVAALAGWDPSLADRLLEADRRELAEPLALLSAVAEERGWNGSRVLTADWALGTSDFMGDRFHPHSAYLAAIGDLQALSERVWQSQIGVAFPLLEQLRRHYIKLCRLLLPPPPYDCGYEGMLEADELEFGPLSYFLGRSRMGQQVREEVRRLRDIRNALAHGRSLTAGQMEDLLGLARKLPVGGEVG